jgi:hypothetical protein
MKRRNKPATVAEIRDWKAYLLEAEMDFDAAVADLRAIGSTDEDIIRYSGAARERVQAMKTRYEARLTAFLAFRSAHERR